MRTAGCVLFAILWCALPSAGQLLPQVCAGLKTKLSSLVYKYSRYRTDSPPATITAIESDLGKPTHVEATADGFVARYLLNGCIGEVIFTNDGAFSTVQFRPTLSAPAPPATSAERIQYIENRIQNLKREIEKLEAIKERLGQQDEAALPSTSGAAPTLPMEQRTPPPASGTLILEWTPVGSEKAFGYGNWDKALLSYTVILDRDPDHSQALLRRGYSYYKFRRFKEAIQDYSRLIENDSKEVEAYKARAAAYSAIGDTERATADVDAAKLLEVSAGKVGAPVPETPTVSSSHSSTGSGNGKCSLHSRYGSQSPRLHTQGWYLRSPAHAERTQSPKVSTPLPRHCTLIVVGRKTSNEIPPMSAVTIPGLSYIGDYISVDEQDSVLAEIDRQPWLMDLKRRVQHYGYRYDYKHRTVDTSQYLGPLPSWAASLAERLHAEGRTADRLDQLIVNEYEPGMGIASHIDCEPCFGDTILAISLGSPCVMALSCARTQRTVDVLLEPRSLIVFQDEARYHWKHGISKRKTDHFDGKVIRRTRRVSLTFRSVVLSGGSLATS